eukprot:comp11510_c0_seq1/m.5957 comp11510_c0_seq1/g.5957  ORF comp11510_c0_seq1/g.5957 comp11510_c0_seq1/m.5957 type:complete len:253 (-) comp11510_c0_seq1:227-985(-)
MTGKRATISKEQNIEPASERRTKRIKTTASTRTGAPKSPRTASQPLPGDEARKEENQTPASVTRCGWVKAGNSVYEKYHDEEWGVPEHRDSVLFEFLILEGAQAGLNWETILKKRENYRSALDGFDPVKISKYDAAKVRQLLDDPGIVRNRLKVEATVANAKAFLEVQKQFGSFDSYVWGFVNNKPIQNKVKSLKDVPTKTEVSDRMSADLKKRGFRFVGTTICYAFMQAMGLVNDHEKACFRCGACTDTTV